jgi:DNA repair exonuclease SbcCD ATPase subunit
MTAAEDRVDAERQRMGGRFQAFVAKMQEEFTSLAETNRKLQEQLVVAESQVREIKTIDQSKIAALEERVKTAEATVEAMRQEMTNSVHIADQKATSMTAEAKRAQDLLAETNRQNQDTCKVLESSGWAWRSFYVYCIPLDCYEQIKERMKRSINDLKLNEEQQQKDDVQLQSYLTPNSWMYKIYHCPAQVGAPEQPRKFTEAFNKLLTERKERQVRK